MNIGKEMGVGPALRVLRHYKERRRYYQIKFPSGERTVVLIAGMPARSWPNLISSALYAAASVLLFLSFSSGEAQMSKLLVTGAAALAFSIASGIARERSESIFSSALLHFICAAALILSGGLLFSRIPSRWEFAS